MPEENMEQIEISLEYMDTEIHELQQQTSDKLIIYDKNLDELIDMTLVQLIQQKTDLQHILTPLEIAIRRYELKIKSIQILLKNTQEYMETFKTIKAREEAATLLLEPIKTRLLNLKEIRNKFRDINTLYDTVIGLEITIMEETDAQN